MTVYADYTFYTDTYHGNSMASSSDFSRLELQAAAVIDQLTFNRALAVVQADEDSATIAKIYLADCSIADELKRQETSGPAVSSERVGNLSVSYVNQVSDEKRIVNAAKRFIGDTGLMFQGFTESER